MNISISLELEDIQEALEELNLDLDAQGMFDKLPITGLEMQLEASYSINRVVIELLKDEIIDMGYQK